MRKSRRSPSLPYILLMAVVLANRPSTATTEGPAEKGSSNPSECNVRDFRLQAAPWAGRLAGPPHPLSELRPLFPAETVSQGKRTLQVGENVVRLSPAVQVAAIVGSTLISEDLTCISVGTLIHHRKIPWLRGGAACFLGIYIGDLGFFFLGRLAGGRLLKLRFFSRALGEQRLKEFGEWFDRKPWAAIMACRFLPGIRVPLYLSVGALSHRTKAFFWWTCFFAFVWTPALIGGVVLLGNAITEPLDFLFGRGWWTIPVTVAVIFVIVKAVILLSTAEGRQKLKKPFLSLISGAQKRSELPQDVATGKPTEERRPKA